MRDLPIDPGMAPGKCCLGRGNMHKISQDSVLKYLSFKWNSLNLSLCIFASSLGAKIPWKHLSQISARWSVTSTFQPQPIPRQPWTPPGAPGAPGSAWDAANVDRSWLHPRIVPPVAPRRQGTFLIPQKCQKIWEDKNDKNNWAKTSQPQLTCLKICPAFPTVRAISSSSSSPSSCRHIKGDY